MQHSLRERFLYFCLAAGLAVAAAVCPASVLAQAASSGSAPAFNKAVQGETAGTVEGAVENAMNWVGNVICPLLSVGAGVHAVMQFRSGGRWLPSAATGIGLLSISGIIRLAEYFVQMGAGGIGAN
ncbi:MAG: hypothetical protein QJR10_10345 [Bacillota bacterium]|nr:hypothetical protein [Bacillota bacterium]